MYADYGVGPCCGGIFRLRTAELRETYRRHIPEADKMERDDLIKAILRFERSQLAGRPITCNAVASEGRVCDGLDRYTNQELPWHFPDILGDCAVVDDDMTLGEAAAYLGISQARLIELIHDGTLVANQAGFSKKINKQSLNAYLASRIQTNSI
jgi:excisionase family DNA binding protein